MASFADLTPCTLFPGEWHQLLAVGWLSASEPFPTAEPDLVLARRILDRRNNWCPPNVDSDFFHPCPLCPPEQQRGERGLVFVPSDRALFVAPALIAHLIRAHRYDPPAEFVGAVNQPPPSRRALLTEIGRFFPALEVPPRPPPGQYDGFDITVIEGLEPIRRRPAMYVGTGEPSLDRVLRHALSDSVTQGLAGREMRIDVVFAPDGRVVIEHDGEGFAVKDGTSPLLRENFATLHVPSRSLSAIVNALSSEFAVENRHAGRAWRLSWEYGAPVEPLTCLGRTQQRGTRIEFRLDGSLLDSNRLDHVAGRLLHEYSFLLPQVDFRLNANSLGRRNLQEWIRELEPAIVEDTVLNHQTTTGTLSVAVALGWSPIRDAPLVKSFVNLHPTADSNAPVWWDRIIEHQSG